MNYMLMPLRRYADFNGRSRRKEFWLWQLFNLVVVGILYAILMGILVGAMSRASADGGKTTEYSSYESSDSGFEASSGTSTHVDPALFMQEFGTGGIILSVLLVLYGLLVFIPSLAVVIRRLHDQDKSGWFILLGLIPFVGGIVLLVFYCLDGTRGPNRFGPDPKGNGSYDHTFA